MPLTPFEREALGDPSFLAQAEPIRTPPDVQPEKLSALNVPRVPPSMIESAKIAAGAALPAYPPSMMEERPTRLLSQAEKSALYNDGKAISMLETACKASESAAQQSCKPMTIGDMLANQERHAIDNLEQVRRKRAMAVRLGLINTQLSDLQDLIY